MCVLRWTGKWPGLKPRSRLTGSSAASMRSGEQLRRPGSSARPLEPRSCSGKSIGMWIDRSLQLTGQLNDSHVTALLELARKRQAEPIDLADDETDT